jgi:hypothetical protein
MKTILEQPGCVQSEPSRDLPSYSRIRPSIDAKMPSPFLSPSKNLACPILRKAKT